MKVLILCVKSNLSESQASFHQTPGIFTIFCPHGVCYGLEAMKHCESPRHPFEIFTDSKCHHQPSCMTMPAILAQNNKDIYHSWVLSTSLLSNKRVISTILGSYPLFSVPIRQLKNDIYQFWCHTNVG